MESIFFMEIEKDGTTSISTTVADGNNADAIAS